MNKHICIEFEWLNPFAREDDDPIYLDVFAQIIPYRAATGPTLDGPGCPEEGGCIEITDVEGPDGFDWHEGINTLIRQGGVAKTVPLWQACEEYLHDVGIEIYYD